WWCLAATHSGLAAALATELIGSYEPALQCCLLVGEVLARHGDSVVVQHAKCVEISTLFCAQHALITKPDLHPIFRRAGQGRRRPSLWPGRPARERPTCVGKEC